MLRPVLSILLALLGAFSFLPRGKGALILILGGMVVLTFSLLLSSFVRRRSADDMEGRSGSRKARPARNSFATRPVAPAAGGISSPAPEPWMRAVMATASRAGLGRPELLESEPLRHVVFLADCRACRGRRRGSGCEHERSILERVMRTFAPQGRVVELTCNADRRGGCTFELRPGAFAQ